MIVIYQHNGQQLMCRGEDLGAWRRFLLFLHMPIRMRAFSQDDIYDVPANSIGHIQTLTDEEAIARRRKQEADAEAKKEQARLEKEKAMADYERMAKINRVNLAEASLRIPGHRG